jgi:iron complex outermembrane receptor protein
LSAGPLSLALGGEYRREELEDLFAPVVSGGDLLGFGGALQGSTGSRKVSALFTEVNVPIIKGLEAALSVRHDDYSDFGQTTNPKIAFRWQPAKAFLARASYGKGFRAPTLADLYTSQQTGNTANNHDDPLRCPSTGLTTDCNLQFNNRTGGNPNLKPEKSEQATLGLVIEPFQALSVALDFWKINKSQQIGVLSDDTIFADLPKYEANGTVQRGTVEPNRPTLPGPIVFVNQFTVNLGSLRSDGVDLDLNYRTPKTDWGRFGFNLTGTYIRKFQFQTEQNGAYFNNVGVFFNGAPIFRWQHYAALTWDMGPWAATLAQNFQTGYTDEAPDVNGNPRRVDENMTWDLQGQYSGIKNLKFTLGIRNLFDEDPPFSNQGQTFPVGYDPRFTDPRGRFYYSSINYSFK